MDSLYSTAVGTQPTYEVESNDMQEREALTNPIPS